MTKKVYNVEIAGIPFRLKSTQDEKTVANLVNFVDTKIREALPSVKNNAFSNAVILASLNIAGELMMLKQRANVSLEKIETKAQKLLTDLEATRSSHGLNN